jgi:hypothetical protein
MAFAIGKRATVLVSGQAFGICGGNQSGVAASS